jgi:hypothetical protein
VETSGVVQPPVHAIAVHLIHEADREESDRHKFLARLYPKLRAWHAYLRERRDLDGSGLVAIVHPWESGMDNSPAWDTALERVEPAPPGSFTRRDTDHAGLADRPTDLDYGRYVRLAATYRDHGYDDARTPFEFAVEDPGFNALLIAAEHALAAIAVELNADPGPHLTAAAELTTALSQLFANGNFHVRDVTNGRLIEADTVAGLVPLVVPDLPQCEELLDTARGPKFRLGEVAMVPSYDLTGPSFDRSRYWRGPSWFNTAWLIHRGLRRLDVPHLAEHLRDDVLTLARQTGFAEYVDPLSGAPRGARDFSWTAALALDLLETP